MKAILLIPLAFLVSCQAVDLIVDTSEAVPVGPERIIVPSSAVTPVISQTAVNELVEAGNGKLEEIVINATK